jgi:hypothetical protein
VKNTEIKVVNAVVTKQKMWLELAKNTEVTVVIAVLLHWYQEGHMAQSEEMNYAGE